MFQPRTGHFERRARGQWGGCGMPSLGPARRNRQKPGTQEAAARGGKIGPSCWAVGPLAVVLGAGSLPGGLAELGSASQGGGPSWLAEKASCEAEVFETLTNKVFFFLG